MDEPSSSKQKNDRCEVSFDWSASGRTAGVSVRVAQRVVYSSTLRRFRPKSLAEFLEAVRTRLAERKLGELSDGDENRLREKIESQLADGPGMLAASGPSYAYTTNGIVLRTADGDKQLCNFNAKIRSAKTIVGGDDDVQQVFEIVAWWDEPELCDAKRSQSVRVDASRFEDLKWAIEHLGARAIILAGNGIRNHVHVAIQCLSQASITESTMYSHTGWRRFGGSPFFLTATGALGADGLSTEHGVELPEKLQRIKLQAPPNKELLRAAIRASLRCLKTAPWEATLPLLCGTYRAPLGDNGQMLQITGTTGSYKTSMCIPLLQHFGADHESSKLPNWSSTSGANEALLYLAKDCVQILDDFVPGEEGSRRLHQKSGRLIRSAANQTGRDRLDRTSRLKASSYYPRSFTFITGEESQRGASVVARTWEVRLVRESVNLEALTSSQGDGISGILAQAMSGYITYLADGDRIGKLDLNAERQRILEELRSETDLGNAKGIHPRGPTNLADLLVGWRFFLDFASEERAIAPGAAAALWKRGRNTLAAQLTGQSKRQVATSAADTFIRVLQQLIQSKQVHLTLKRGQKPKDPGKFGYRDASTAGLANPFWEARGTNIGFVDEERGEAFLYPDVALREVQRTARENGAPIEFGLDAVRDQLRERGLLIAEERGDGKKRPLTRVRMEGGKRLSLMRMPIGRLLDDDDSDGSSES